MSALYPAGGEFTVDGVSSDTWRCFYRNYSVGMFPTLRTKATDIAGRAGKWNAFAEFSSRKLTVDLTFANRATMVDDMSSLAAALDPRSGTHKLVLKDDQPNKYLNVQVQGDSPMSPTVTSGELTLGLEAMDPFWYFTIAQHLTFDKTQNQTFTLPNAGNAEAAPVFTITRTAATGAALTGIKLAYNGAFIQYNGTINIGDTLVVDTGGYTVTKNGTPDINNWTGDFPVIPVGGSVVTYTDTNSIGAHIVVDYGERNQ